MDQCEDPNEEIMGLKWIALWFLKTCLAKQFYKVHFLLFVTSATQ